MAIIRANRAWRGDRPAGPFQLNQDSQQARGLVAWFPLAGLGDSRCRISGDALVGADFLLGTTLDGGTIPPQSPVIRWGMPYTAGTNVVLGPNTTRYDIGAAMSALAWVRFMVGTPSDKSPFGRWNTTGWMIYMNGGKIRGYIGTANVEGTTVITDTTRFYRLGYTWDGTTIRVYVDGREENSGAGSSPGVGNVPVEIGSYANTAGGQLSGVITDCRLYNRALSAAEMWADYDPATRWDLYRVPSRRLFVDAPAAAAFKSAWARNANVILQPGVIR